jgi:hypothetical protein
MYRRWRGVQVIDLFLLPDIAHGDVKTVVHAVLVRRD